LSERWGTGKARIVVCACAIGLLAPALVVAAGDGARRAPGDDLVGKMTGRTGELRETVAITRSRGAGEASVLSLALPHLRSGDRVRFNGEVTVTTTCVESLPRCIGRRYRFDPRLQARVVLADGKDDAGPGSRAVSGTVGVRCEQNRPNRNHHCPLVIKDAITIGGLGGLPCSPARCRLNMLLGAHHRDARGGEVVVVGADQPDGSVEGGKSRLSAAVVRADADVRQVAKRTTKRLVDTLPASFDAGQRVVYSKRLRGLERGDVLLTSARVRTAIRDLPYFVATKIVIARKPTARHPKQLAARFATRKGTATETNGFNCTVGPSAFRSPCRTKKEGLIAITRTPGRPLYVNVVSRTFPKIAQARRGSYPPARVLPGGWLRVTRLHAGN
jgi:hypothetical protein